jgi:hypothetical protein
LGVGVADKHRSERVDPAIMPLGDPSWHKASHYGGIDKGLRSQSREQFDNASISDQVASE